MVAERIEPILNQVLLERVAEGDRETEGGIVLPGERKDASSWRCKVLARGPGAHKHGFFHETNPKLQVGVQCYVPAFQGYKTHLGVKEYLLVKDDEVLAVVARD